MTTLGMRYAIGAFAFMLVCALSYYKGYQYEKRKFEAFVAETKAIAHAQQAENERIIKKHEADKEDIHNDYQARLVDLRRQYASGVQRGTGGSPVPAASRATKGANAAASNDGLAAQCAETTLQLVELQEWVKRTYQ